MHLQNSIFFFLAQLNCYALETFLENKIVLSIYGKAIKKSEFFLKMVFSLYP
jgi:hypothetical protein